MSVGHSDHSDCPLTRSRGRGSEPSISKVIARIRGVDEKAAATQSVGAAVCRCRRTASADFDRPQECANRDQSKLGMRLMRRDLSDDFLRNSYASENDRRGKSSRSLTEHQEKTATRKKFIDRVSVVDDHERRVPRRTAHSTTGRRHGDAHARATDDHSRSSW